MIIYRKSEIPEHLQQYFQPAELGLERTPELYVERMVEVFREMKRVLRDDGTLWLNLGISYAGYWGDKYAHKPFGEDRTADSSTPPNKPSLAFGGKSANRSPLLQRVPACGNDGKVSQDSQGADRACHDCDDAHQGEIQSHHARNAHNAQCASQDVQPTSQIGRDSEHLDCDREFQHFLQPDVQESTIEQSSCLPSGASSLEATALASPKEQQTTSPESDLSAHRLACTYDTSQMLPPLVVRTQGKESFYSACGRSDCKGIGRCGLCWCSLSIPSLNVKPKDELNIPHLVAMALQADGWYLRQTIIWHKPNPMPESVTDRCTKAHEYIFLFAKGQRKSRIVKFSDLDSERHHLIQDVLFKRSLPWPTNICVGLATSIFYLSQFQENFSLPPLYSEVWQQRLDCSDRDFVRSLPPKHIPSVWSARFLSGDVSAKVFFEKLDSLRFALSDSDYFLESGVMPELLNSPSFKSDGKGTVAVHDSGQISKVDFFHKHIVSQMPTTCKYYYDAAAIVEAAKWERWGNQTENKKHSGAAGHLGNKSLSELPIKDTKNRRSVWTVSTAPFTGAHFATFPPKLIEPCILAGCPSTVCDKCGSPHARITETQYRRHENWFGNKQDARHSRGKAGAEYNEPIGTTTLGFKPTCECDSGTRSGIVIDPFIGAGTTAIVSYTHGRKFIGIELSQKYLDEITIPRIEAETRQLRIFA